MRQSGDAVELEGSQDADLGSRGRGGTDENQVRAPPIDRGLEPGAPLTRSQGFTYPRSKPPGAPTLSLLKPLKATT